VSYVFGSAVAAVGCGGRSFGQMAGMLFAGIEMMRVCGAGVATLSGWSIAA
jgi:hypothetical protein